MTTPHEGADPAVSTAPGRKLRRPRGGLSIQSKLLIMLLAVSLVSSVIVGIIGYVNGRESLREAATDQLTTIRELRTDAIRTFITRAEQGVVLDSRNLSAQQASAAFNAGWDELQQQPVSAENDATLESYYRDVFIPQYEQRSQKEQSDSALIPTSNAGRYLQSQYTARFDDFDAALAFTDAGDGSAWSAAHATYHDYFQRLIEQVGYEDLLVLNTTGDVVYSAYKGIDLGISVEEGAYAQSSLADAYRAAMASNDVNAVEIRDLENWAPSLGKHALWVVSPIGSDAGVTGVLAAQISLDQVNAVMTGNRQWAEQGLGKTGEVYLAGRDHLMRSLARGIVEDRDSYADQVIANGTPPDRAARMAFVGGTVGLQPVNTFAVDQALLGKKGTGIAHEYIGSESLVAYAPVDIDGLDWVIVARKESSEAFAPVTDFTRNLLLSMLGIMLAVSVLSLLLAQVFTRPIRRLVDAVRRVGAGDLAVQVPTDSRDEFGDLGRAFNDMASGLRVRQDLINEQQAENRRLMLTLMPESVADRYKAGEQTIAEQHENVSVVYAELVGFDDYAASLDDGQEVTQLNTLMRGFDEAAVKAGIEKVRTLRGGYLASSGLGVPRVDNVRRAVDFALLMRDVIERFNAQNNASIGLRAGVDTGSVTSGLVARTNLAYDLWGDAVSLAYRARKVTPEPGVYVSDAVRDRLQDTVAFAKAGTVESRGRTQTVWRVEA
ncbi:adenylate/guanylate cyclase domain-containing protein [Microbacterium flavum]|uniref:HAMP domain-containing protein n=1 Tax=Microbacterium flavum TaxID=415216 RepID=A0ABS5XTF4_9MICO|nr:adenylate/guanylate cyclase domain-containing protein [Microbacterium flavum]MBT8797794.1 HAMP domain-containing protein [Microbacterium flavum]